MKIRKAVFLLIILILTLPAIYIFAFFSLPSQYNDSFLGELKYKYSLLKNTEGKRIVIIGGSSVPFSIKSDLINASFPEYKTIDFGMYAGLGTSIMLDMAKSNIHNGDIIIISPEQDSEALSMYFNGKYFLQAADGAAHLLKYALPEHFQSIAVNFPDVAGKKIYYCFCGSPTPTDIYSRTSFNEYGDIASEDRAYNIMAKGYDANSAIEFSASIISDEFISYVNNFINYANQCGATVYYRFSPMNSDAVSPGTTYTDINNYYNYLSEQLICPVLGNPHNSIMDSEWFYDTNFHLNSNGAIVFTYNLIEDLKIIFNDTSVTNIAIPDAPSFADADIQNRDNTYEEYFTYICTGETYQITGLTDEGKELSKIVIPYSHNGKKITDISPDIFKNNEIITEITLQDNIGMLYDYMFSGCAKLRKVMLLSDIPSTFTVGDNFMYGADFNIYVSETAYSNFMRHYSWQKYSDFIRCIVPTS